MVLHSAAKKVGLPTSPPYLSLVNEFSKNKMSFLTGASFASGGARILDRTDPYAVGEAITSVS